MKAILFSLLITVTAASAIAQPDYFDIPLLELNISHNKGNYNDHQNSRNQQAVSTATVSTWKQFNNNFKKLHDQLDKRLTTVYAVVADASTVIEIGKSLGKVVEFQQKTLQEVGNNPEILPLVIERQIGIYKQALKLYSFTSLLVLSYNDLNKMKAATRNAVYQELRSRLYLFVLLNEALYYAAKQYDLGQRLRNTKGFLYFERDKEIVKDILNIWK